MGVAERNNRTVILDRAEELFARGGYDAVGVQELVDAAGVTKPTLYHYFGSKGGVLRTLFAERFAPFLAELDRAIATDESLTGRLTRVVEAYFRVARTQPLLYRLHLASWFGSPGNEAAQVVGGYVQCQQDALERLFIDASASHGNMRGRERIYASTLIGIVNGRIALAVDGGPPLDDHAVRQTVQHFSHGIYS